MRGDVVVVRAFGGRPLKRRVWDVGDTVVYVTDDEQFEKLAAGKRGVAPIGFPKEDVFNDTENESCDESVVWSQLVLWRA